MHRTATALLLAAGLCLSGCSKAQDGDRTATEPGATKRKLIKQAPTKAPAKEKRMFEVKTSADLSKLSAHYMKLWSDGFDGVLEVSFAPGTYPETGWSLEPDPAGRRGKKPSRIDVVLQGNGAVLAALPGAIRARSLRLENLVLTGMRSAPMSIHVNSALELVGCAVMEARFGDPNWMGPHIEVFAESAHKRQKTPVRVVIKDSWFIRNFQGTKGMSMLSLAPSRAAPGYFEEVLVQGSTFLGNAYMTAELNLDLAKSVRIEGSVFYKTWPAGILIRATSSEKVVVKDSTIVVEQIEHVGAVASTPAIVFEGTRIFSKSPKGAIPAALAIPDSMVLDRKLFEPHEAALKEATASKPTGVPSAALRKRIDDALSASK